MSRLQKLTAGKDLKVTRRGNIAWMTVPMHISMTAKDEKRARLKSATRDLGAAGANWLLVHEHLSEPMGG